MSGQHRDLLGIFANHRVAANLLMVMMLLAGAMALKKLNVQFFPDFELEIISVSTLWSGASAEDIQTGITVPLEQRLRIVDNLDTMNSTSAPGVSGITLEFKPGTDMITALNQVQQKIDDFRNLPSDAEDPRVVHAVRYESVARLLISGLSDYDEMRYMVRRFEDELLALGIDKVDVNGLPEEAIHISVEPEQLYQLQMNLQQIGDQVSSGSLDMPAGLAGEDHGSRELRIVSQCRTPECFAQMSLENNGRQLSLGDLAQIEKRAKSQQQTITINGEKVVEMVLSRAANGDSLRSAEILDQWLEDIRPTLPDTVTLKVFNERWQLIKERIMVLVKNGLGGLVLVLIILYLFLSGRVAFWVAVGIPISFAATLAVIYLSGGSINMVSLFALIMGLGIIVDDAIVVGEDAQAHYDRGENSLMAAEGGARRMLAPVMASSLTTIAAFFPLLLVGGMMGNIMGAIPLVIISVIIASLIESFYILPGHLRHAFQNEHHAKHGRVREILDNSFTHFRDRGFRPFVTMAINHRWTTIAFAIMILIMAIGLVAGGRLSFHFFPSPESTTVYANVRFVSGSDPQKVDQFMHHLEESLQQTINDLPEKVVETYYMLHGGSSGRGRGGTGERFGSVYVELTAPDARKTQNKAFIKAWKKQVKEVAGIESFTITARRTGPSSNDLEIRLLGQEPEKLKLAAIDLAGAIAQIDGVSGIDDDLAYGWEQLIFTIKPAGEIAGLSLADLSRQLRRSYDGALLQIFQQGADEVEVRMQINEARQRDLSTLDQLPIRMPDGRMVALESVADWSSRQGFENLRRSEGKLAVTVVATVDESINNSDDIIAGLNEVTMPSLQAQYGIDYSYEGRAANQRDTMADLRTGVMLGLLFIYLVLAWVFGSYGWPILVMMVIPLGLTGAIFGHWLTGQNLTLLSLFGFFGLSGIVVNDSIILVTFYKELRAKGMAIQAALIEAACQRLRAVLLTSLTTVAGLTPLLFETSRQAQFLIPMATSIAFGLAFATVLILLIVPSLLSIYESVRHRKESI